MRLFPGFALFAGGQFGVFVLARWDYGEVFASTILLILCLYLLDRLFRTRPDVDNE